MWRGWVSTVGVDGSMVHAAVKVTGDQALVVSVFGFGNGERTEWFGNLIRVGLEYGLVEVERLQFGVSWTKLITGQIGWNDWTKPTHPPFHYFFH